jgi:hypothetical protein
VRCTEKQNNKHESKKVKQMNTNQNPLDMDLGSVPTDFPLIAAGGPYDFIIKNTEIKPNSAGNKMLVLLLESVNPVPAANTGEQLAAGQKVFEQINLVATGKATNEMIVRNIGALVQSAKLSGVTLGNIDNWHPSLQGRIVRCNIKVQPQRVSGGRTYNARNGVANYLVN